MGRYIDCLKNGGEIRYSDCNGFYGYGGNISRYVDWDGKPISRTPDEYRYSYDAYVVSKKADNYKHVVYSDRLLQWDYNKHDKLCQKHFGNKSQYWDGRSFEKIESFLRDFFDDKELQLVGIMKGCNISSGYPYWIFMYNLIR